MGSSRRARHASTPCSGWPSATALGGPTRIFGEATDAIVEIHSDIPPKQIAVRFVAMDETFEDARPDGWEVVERRVTGRDPDDVGGGHERPGPETDR